MRLYCISFERLGVILWVVRRHIIKDRKNFFFVFFCVIQTSQKVTKHVCAINQQIKKLKIYVKEHVITSSVLLIYKWAQKTFLIKHEISVKRNQKNILYIPQIKNFSLLNICYTRPSKNEKSLSRNRMKIWDTYFSFF